MYKEITEIYNGLERLEEEGEIVNAYGGAEIDIDNPDELVLMDLVEYIDKYYPDARPAWMEAFYQVFIWQFSSMYEGSSTYYSNFYGDSSYDKIVQTADFLDSNGYTVIADIYRMGISSYRKEEPAGSIETGTAGAIDIWVNWNTKPVWEFYLDVLKKHKDEITSMAIQGET